MKQLPINRDQTIPLNQENNPINKQKNFIPPGFRVRDRLTIIADILRVTRQWTRTSILLRKVNITYNLTRWPVYRAVLIDTGLLEAHLSSGYLEYRTTEKGRQFLRIYETLQQFLQEVQG